MSKEFASIRTEDLLKLENAGGIISGGHYPQGIRPGADIQEWFVKMPLVSAELISLWRNMCEAKHNLAEWFVTE
jgi:hypothetical protein